MWQKMSMTNYYCYLVILNTSVTIPVISQSPYTMLLSYCTERGSLCHLTYKWKHVRGYVQPHISPGNRTIALIVVCHNKKLFLSGNSWFNNVIISRLVLDYTHIIQQFNMMRISCKCLNSKMLELFWHSK
jgi:hypothetical protein